MKKEYEIFLKVFINYNETYDFSCNELDEFDDRCDIPLVEIEENEVRKYLKDLEKRALKFLRSTFGERKQLIKEAILTAEIVEEDKEEVIFRRIDVKNKLNYYHNRKIAELAKKEIKEALEFSNKNKIGE